MNPHSSGDAAVKQILVWMDATAERRFIVQDLDDTHLIVNADAVDSTLRALEEHVRLPCLIQLVTVAAHTMDTR